MGFSHCTDHRKVKLLKLGPEHVPFPCSLRELVLDRYGEPTGVGNHAHPMQLEELLEYLKNIDNFSLSPWVALAAQTEAIGDPATPSREQIAILRWLGKALELWEKQSPMEGRVAAQVRRLKPLSAALALTDPTFLQPGAHPLHQLLDSIQARAIGWQARLDRVGAILEQQVTKSVDDSRAWFDKPSTNLASISADFSAAAERDQSRANRMVQRVVEAEAGKVKTAAAKKEAARMINTALEKHPAPEEIGGFLKGPWYTSAQLVLLKFGAESEQWTKMSATTSTLLDSFQHSDDADDTRRQHIFEVVTQLPKEMRRWLLSLHHDTEAVNESMGLVEFAHLRILRRQPLDLLHITPIVVEGEHTGAVDTQMPAALGNWQEGQWFSVDTGKEGTIRAQLVLKVEQSQQLLFTNMAGIKVLQLSYAEFQNLLAQGKVQALSSGASFSLCLAHAVGIDSVEILDALVSALAAAPAPTSPDPEPISEADAGREPAGEPEQEFLLEQHTGLTPEPEAELELHLEPELDLDSDPGQQLDAELNADLTLDLDAVLELEAEPVPEPEPEPESNQDPDQDLHRYLQPEPETGPTPERSAADEADAAHGYLGAQSSKLDDGGTATPTEHATQDESKPAPAQEHQRGSGFLIDQAEEIRARGGYLIRRAEEFPEEYEIEEIIATPVEGFDEPELPTEPVEELAEDLEPLPDATGEDEEIEAFLSSQAEPEPEPEITSGAPSTTREINLPMGAWLGFHDGDTPLMARLAVYDLENDQYIFVNRKGVKMRQVSKQELLDLIDKELVDVLETQSNFRDEVTEVRKNLDQE